MLKNSESADRLAIGIALGVVIGLALDNLALGVGVGVALGAAGTRVARKKLDQDEES